MSTEKSIPLCEVPGIQPIQPARFLWHLSRPENRSGILRLGLRADFSGHDCIFANNQSEKLRWFYPFCVAHYYGEPLTESDFAGYDYWRIDTAVFSASWFVDPNMAHGKTRMTPHEWRYFSGHERHFVCTETSPPAAALRLFHYNPTARGVVTYFGDGVAHTVVRKLPLRPVSSPNTFTLPDSPHFRAA